jgi:uncharacterized phiE125 gp8 family phage protein
MGALNLVAGPTSEPVTLQEAKSHLRVTTDDDDALIQSHLEAARERVELETGRQLLTATWELWLDRCPGASVSDSASGGTAGALDLGAPAWLAWNDWWARRFIDVPRPPLQAVVSVTYVDTAGVQQTWDPALYQVHKPSGPLARRGRIQPAYGVAWPVTRDQMDAVVVRFTAGYGAAGSTVPQMLRRAMLLIAGDFYGNREATIVNDSRMTVETLPYGVADILRQYRARPILRAVA